MVSGLRTVLHGPFLMLLKHGPLNKKDLSWIKFRTDSDGLIQSPFRITSE